jgi:hypothetical protein
VLKYVDSIYSFSNPQTYGKYTSNSCIVYVKNMHKKKVG